MDINDARIIITVVSFATFIAIVVWAWSSRQRADFEEAANHPVLDDDSVVAIPVSSASNGAVSRPATGGRA